MQKSRGIRGAGTYWPPFTFLRSHAVSAGFFGRSFTGFSSKRTPNSRNHSCVHYSLSEFRGEWFTNHSNHIHTFTPIKRIVATKGWNACQTKSLPKPFWVGWPVVRFCSPHLFLPFPPAMASSDNNLLCGLLSMLLRSGSFAACCDAL